MQTNKGSNAGIVLMIAETLGIPLAIHMVPALESRMAPVAAQYENATREETLDWLARSIDELPLDQWELALKPITDEIEMLNVAAEISRNGIIH